LTLNIISLHSVINLYAMTTSVKLSKSLLFFRKNTSYYFFPFSENNYFYKKAFYSLEKNRSYFLSFLENNYFDETRSKP